MKVLGIETATYCGGLAVIEDVRPLGTVLLNTSQTHSVRLMPALDFLLNQLGLKLQELDGIGISLGPGSFTGIRIGISVAKGLAISAGLKLAGVSTLEALANRFYLPGRIICPVIDARRGELFAATFAATEDGLKRISPDLVLTIDDLLAQRNDETIFLGDGALKYRKEIVEQLGDKASFAPPHRYLPSAEEVALLAWNRLKKGEADDPYLLEPQYIRKSDAERKRSG